MYRQTSGSTQAKMPSIDITVDNNMNKMENRKQQVSNLTRLINYCSKQTWDISTAFASVFLVRTYTIDCLRAVIQKILIENFQGSAAPSYNCLSKGKLWSKAKTYLNLKNAIKIKSNMLNSKLARFKLWIKSNWLCEII